MKETCTDCKKSFDIEDTICCQGEFEQDDCLIHGDYKTRCEDCFSDWIADEVEYIKQDLKREA